MKVEGWNPGALDDLINEAMPEKLVASAKEVAGEVRRRCPVGTVSRPMYKRGKYAGQPWTARDKGQLKRSVRVVQKKGKTGRILLQAKNIRVYAGHYLAWYASIVEYYTPFMRPGFNAALGRVKDILGAK